MNTRDLPVIIVRASILALALSSVAVYLLKAVPQLVGTHFDDAYMFLRYAQHFLAGAGFSWNADEGATYGLTSTLHLLTITAVRKWTSLSNTEVLTAASFGSGVASSVALASLGFQVLDDEFRRSWAPLLVLPCLLFSGLFEYHSLSGMETQLSVLCNSLLVLSVVSLSKRDSAFRVAACVTAAYLSVLARPDNGVYALMFPPLFLVASDRRLARSAAVYAATVVAILATDLAIKHAFFGDALPLSFYVKRTGFSRGYLGAYKWNAAAYMLDFLAACLPYLIAIAYFGSRRAVSRLIAIVVPLTATFAYFLTVNQVMGFGARLYYPSLPYVVLAALVTVQQCPKSSTGTLPLRQGGSTAWILTAVVALFVLTSSAEIHSVAARVWQEHAFVQPSKMQATRRYAVRAATALPELGWWDSILEMTSLLRTMPSDVVVGASEYGYLGAELPAIRIVDLVGLQDRYMAHHGFSANYVLSRKPDILWFPHPDYAYATKEILDNIAFTERYEYYPGAYDYGIAISRLSPRYGVIAAAFEREFSRLYAGRTLADYRAAASPIEKHIE